MTNDDPWATINHRIDQLTEEIRAYRAERARVGEAVGQHVITALTAEFGPRHEHTTNALTALEDRIAAVEGRIDINEIIVRGLPGVNLASTGRPLREIYHQIQHAADTATRTGEPQRIDIPDGDTRIVARIKPGADASSVLQDICSP